MGYYVFATYFQQYIAFSRKPCPLLILKGAEKEMTSSAVIAYQMGHKNSLRFGYLNMMKVII